MTFNNVLFRSFHFIYVLKCGAAYNNPAVSGLENSIKFSALFHQIRGNQIQAIVNCIECVVGCSKYLHQSNVQKRKCSPTYLWYRFVSIKFYCQVLSCYIKIAFVSYYFVGAVTAAVLKPNL